LAPYWFIGSILVDWAAISLEFFCIAASNDENIEERHHG